jgi:serine/threonine protein kinase
MEHRASFFSLFFGFGGFHKKHSRNTFFFVLFFSEKEEHALSKVRSRDFIQFLAASLVKDPTQRASAATLLTHPFIASPQAQDLAPLRDLLRSIEAEVVEVLEDLPENNQGSFSRGASEVLVSHCMYARVHVLVCV